MNLLVVTNGVSLMQLISIKIDKKHLSIAFINVYQKHSSAQRGHQETLQQTIHLL